MPVIRRDRSSRASTPQSVFGTARRALAACAAAVLLSLTAPFGAVAVQAETPRLLTGLVAEASPDGVALTWTVDEARAHLIAGFTCVYRTPGHLRTGVAGTIPCGPRNGPPAARARVVSGLPEYGEYLFEVVARTIAGAGVPWPKRALHARVAVTEELAGPAGPERAVTGVGPLVEGCGPEDEVARPWHQDETVSAAHLTHYPGRGWSAAGDPGADPEWPEPAPIAALIRDAGLDPSPVLAALSGSAADAPAAADTLGDARFEAALARAGSGTKALLRRRADGARELRLHSSYPFGATYLFEARHAVPGWGDAGHPVAFPDLRNREDCPPPGSPGATHDVALALSDAAGGDRRLEHSDYGWWAVSPVGLGPERIVATKAGLSYGAPAQAAPEAGTRWRGRLAGHLFLDRRRWAVGADVTLSLESGTPPRLAGRIDNVTLARLDAKSMQPVAGDAGSIPPLTLGSSTDSPTGPGGWSGLVHVAAEPVVGMPAGMPVADAFQGDWLAAAHGPDAGEIAGRLRLWTPLAAGADPLRDWPSQAVLVAGFGALREDR